MTSLPDDIDVTLVGTGVAPLIAANELIQKGKSVLVLNPEWDFFKENSELPLDPFWPTESQLSTDQISKSIPRHVVDTLRPDYPGPIEFWTSNTHWPGQDKKVDRTDGKDFHDHEAPHVRSRPRLWVTSQDQSYVYRRAEKSWERIEEMYVQALDAGLYPQELDGVLATRYFPGYTNENDQQRDQVKGILVPNLCDVDLDSYRHGLLEYIRDRLGASQVLSDVSQIEMTPTGLSFIHEGSARVVDSKEGVILFWTPGMTSLIDRWVEHPEKVFTHETPAPRNVRAWEEWCLNSKVKIEPGIIGSFEDMTVWAQFEGLPDGGSPRNSIHLTRLSVLRGGSTFALSALRDASFGDQWASADSFDALSRLCHEFYGWSRYSIRSMTPRVLFERDDYWKSSPRWEVSHRSASPDSSYKSYIVGGVDGCVFHVAENARKAAEVISS